MERERQIRNSMIYLLPVFVGNLLPFVALPIFTRILSKEDYGLLALANVYGIFVNGLANFGMQAAYNRNYFQYREDPVKGAQLLYSTILFVMGNFLLLAAITYLFRGRLAAWIMGSDIYGNFLFWALCAQFFNNISYYYLTYYKNSESAVPFVTYTIITTVLNLLIALFLVAYLRLGVIGLVYGQLCGGLTVFGLLSYKFAANMTPALSGRLFRQTLKIGYPLTPKIFVGVIGNQFDKYLIGLLATLGGVGIYSIGQRIALVIFNAMAALYNALQPQVFRQMFEMGDRGGAAVGRYLLPFAYTSTALALLLSLFSEEVIVVLTPSSYHGAIGIVTVLSMYYGFLFFSMHPQLLYAKKTFISSILSMVSIGLNISLNIPFIMRWGAMGAAWGTLLAGLVSGSISFGISQHYYEIKWDYRKLGAIFSIFFIAALTVFLLRHASVPYPWRLLHKGICLAGYLYLGVRLRIITSKNLLLLRNSVPWGRVAAACDDR